jgi:hypothetical protein
MPSHFIKNHLIWILQDGPLISKVVLSQTASILVHTGSLVKTLSERTWSARKYRVTPDGIVGGRSVQHNVHQLANVWYHRCLNVDVGDECRVIGGTVDHVRCSRG